jgi:hypothetical protein
MASIGITVENATIEVHAWSRTNPNILTIAIAADIPVHYSDESVGQHPYERTRLGLHGPESDIRRLAEAILTALPPAEHQVTPEEKLFLAIEATR